MFLFDYLQIEIKVFAPYGTSPMNSSVSVTWRYYSSPLDVRYCLVVYRGVDRHLLVNSKSSENSFTK